MVAKKPTAARSAGKASRPKGNYGKIVSKTQVDLNLAGIEAKARKSVRIPEGNYLCKVVVAETFTANTGNDGIKWAFEVIEGKHKGAGPFYNNTMLMEESLWAVRGTLQALEPRIKIPDSAFKLDLKKYLGRSVAIALVDGEYEGRIRSEIDDVFHPDLLQEDEEDEEEIEADDENEDESEDEEDSDEEDEDEDEEEESDEDEEDEPELLTKAQLRKIPITELRMTAKELGVKIKGLDKTGLVNAILEAQEEDDEELDDEEYDE